MIILQAGEVNEQIAHRDKFLNEATGIDHLNAL